MRKFSLLCVVVAVPFLTDCVLAYEKVKTQRVYACPSVLEKIGYYIKKLMPPLEEFLFLYMRPSFKSLIATAVFGTRGRYAVHLFSGDLHSSDRHKTISGKEDLFALSQTYTLWHIFPFMFDLSLALWCRGALFHFLPILPLSKCSFLVIFSTI